MTTLFYMNPDVLEKPWGTKYDVLMLIFFVLGIGGTSVTFLVVNSDWASLNLRLGLSGAYIGVLLGVLFHLGKQTRKGDEFSQKVLTQSLAQAGMFAMLYTVFMTLLQCVFKTENVGIWALNAPVLFLGYGYLYARVLARQYEKE